MSRRPAALPLIAVLTALLWAPSGALAAAPNQLTDPGADPGAGTVRTTFTLSVRYVSEAGNPAGGVQADVGPVSLELRLVSGSAENGRWSGSTLLPAGSWAVTFRASVSRGPKPTIRGPVLQVSEAPSTLTPAPTATAIPTLQPSQPIPGWSPEPALHPGDATQTPGAEPAPSEPGGDPSVDGPARSASPNPQPSSVAGEGEVNGSRGSAKASPTTGAGAPAAAAGGGASVTDETRGRSPRAGANVTLEGSPGGEPPGLDVALMLLVGVVGAAGLLLLAMGWWLGTGRDDRRPVPAAAASPASSGITAEVAALAERRAVRRARLRSSSDPILASMGLDDAEGPVPGPAPGPASTRNGVPGRARGEAGPVSRSFRWRRSGR